METLRTMFQHHAWATALLIDHCAALPPEQLDLTVPGTAGTIRHTLAHLVAADQRYLRRMDGQEPTIQDREGEPGLADLRAAAERNAARWQAVLGRLDEIDVTIPGFPDETPPYPEIRHAGDLVVLQAIHHGNDHRTHVCTILGANGLEVPELSGWEYYRVGRG